MTTTSAGAVQLDITGNTKPIEQSFSSIELAGKNLGNKLSKMFGTIVSGAFVKSCLEMASSTQQIANRVATAFPTMSKQIEAFASNATHSMGMSAGACRSLVAQYGLMAQGMGMTEEASAGMGAAMTRLTGDMAAFYGMSTDEAASKLQGVFTGMTRGMKTLGVNMSEANLQQHALSLGISQSVSEMSQADLAALRLSYAQATLSKISGYAARNFGTWAGQSAYLSQCVNRLKASLGKALIVALLPALKFINAVISGLATLVNSVIAAIEKLTGKKIADYMGAAAGGAVDMGAAADDASQSLGNLGDSQGKAAKATKKQTKAQKELNRALAGFDKINKLAARSQLENTSPDGSGGGGGSVDAAIPSGLSDAMAAATGFGDALNGINDAGSKLMDITIPPALVAACERLGAAFSRFVGIAKDAGKWVYENVLVPLGKWTISELVPHIIVILADAFEVLCDVLEALKPAWQWLWDHLFKPLAKYAGDAVIAMLDGIAGSLEAIHDFAKAHPKYFENIVIGLAALFGLSKLGGGFGKILGAVVGGKGLGGLKRVFAGGWLGKAGKKLGGLLRVLVKHPVALILLAVATAIGLIYKNWDKIRKTKLGKSIERAGKKLQKLGDKLKPLAKKLNELRDKVFAKLYQKLKEAWPKIEPVLSKLCDFMIDDLCNKISFLIDALSALVDWVSAVADAWSEDGPFGKALQAIMDALQPVADLLGTLRDKRIELTAVAVDKLGSAWDNIKDAWSWLGDKTAYLKGAAQNLMGSVWDTLKSRWDWLKDKTKAIKAKAQNLMGKTWSVIVSRWSWFKDKSRAVKAKCQNLMGNAWKTVQKAWNWFKDKKATLTARFSDAFSGAIKRMWNGVARGINGAIGIINRIPGVSISRVPYLAKGGYIGRNTPALAVLGDNKREGEFVAPDSKMRAMAEEAAQGVDMSRVESLLVELIRAVRESSVDVTLDGKSITRTVVRGINSQTMSTGVSPLVI